MQLLCAIYRRCHVAPYWFPSQRARVGRFSGGAAAEVNVADARSGNAQGAAGGVCDAGKNVQRRQAAAAFDTRYRRLGRTHAPGQLGPGEAGSGAQGIDQFR
jgi:hypothetical protein